MEDISFKELNEEEGETIYDLREYNIKNENNEYSLRLEIKEININIIIYIKDNINYYYKAQMNLSTIVNKLKLDSTRYSTLDLILKLFDEKYDNKNLFINENIIDESCVIIIKFINESAENNYKIKLYKHSIKFEDKFNMFYNQFKLIKNIIDNNKIHEMNKIIIELNNKLEQKDKEIRDIIDTNNNNINEINKKIINLENRIKDLENKNIIKNENINSDDLIKKSENKNKNNNELIIKSDSEIKIINENTNSKNDSNNFNNIKKNINNLTDINALKEEIEKIENNINIKLKNQENIIDKINNVILFNRNKYEYKLNYEFKKEPKNLKFQENITRSNTPVGWNDIFEVFISYKDNRDYLVSPSNDNDNNSDNYNLNIFDLFDNQIIYSLSGHKNFVRTIRYFINNKNKNEYLISADDNRIVIVWDITLNYKIKYKINTKYGHNIYSCLLIFPHDTGDDNYIITSTYNNTGKDEGSATKLYSLKNGKQIKCINNTNNISIYYLLSWYNNRNNNYYIIQFSYKKIMINNLLEDELYSDLIHEPEVEHFSGFIYNKEFTDYLCSSSKNGYINIWDLHHRNLFSVINTNGCKLAHIIEWNKKYIIVADYDNRSFKIIDIDNNSIYNMGTEHKKNLCCVKKINHPKYGESLLTAGLDQTIKIWGI